MIRTILGSVMGLAVAVASVGFFIWLLWVLWSRRDAEETAPVIELEVDEPPPATPEEEVEAPVAAAEAVEEAGEEK
jgi:hypothetical protein